MDATNYGPMLNAYPDSMGGTLKDIIEILKKPQMRDVFSSLYILPSIYHSDLDRGFCVVDYGLNEELATKQDIEDLQDMGFDLKLDFVLNHASAMSPQFQDLLENGDESVYKDFFLPGLLIDALEHGDGHYLKAWAEELAEQEIRVVNMLGCHDGIPLLDLKGLLPDERIKKLIDIVVKRGGYVKDLHGAKNIYYQVNATFFSALGEDERKLILARAIQMFMPGKPQVWYLDLLAGRNDYEAVHMAGEGGHKEINRTNLKREEVETALSRDVVQKQLEIIRFRNRSKAFGPNADIYFTVKGSKIGIVWINGDKRAELSADLTDYTFSYGGE